jgi:hypothetical protein
VSYGISSRWVSCSPPVVAPGVTDAELCEVRCGSAAALRGEGIITAIFNCACW